MSETKEKLTKELIQCKWDDVSGFINKTDLLLVAPELDLVEVGLAFAEDRVDEVKSWLDQNKLQKVNPEETETNVDIPAKTDIRLIIVTPFALAQLVQ